MKNLTKRLIALLSTIVMTLTATLTLSVSALEPPPPEPSPGDFNLRVHFRKVYDEQNELPPPGYDTDNEISTAEKASQRYTEITGKQGTVTALPEVGFGSTATVGMYFQIDTADSAKSLLDGIISDYYNSDIDYEGWLTTGKDNPIPVEYDQIYPLTDGLETVDYDEYNYYTEVESYDAELFYEYLQNNYYEDLTYDYHMTYELIDPPAVMPILCYTYDIRLDGVKTWEEAFAIEEKMEANSQCIEGIVSYTVLYDNDEKYVRYLPDNYKKDFPNNYYSITAYLRSSVDDWQFFYNKNDLKYYFSDLSDSIINISDLGVEYVGIEGMSDVVFDPELVSVVQAETFLNMALKVYYGSSPNAEPVTCYFDDERNEDGCFTATLMGYELWELGNVLDENKERFHVKEHNIAEVSIPNISLTANVYEIILNETNSSKVQEIREEIEDSGYCLKTYINHYYTGSNGEKTCFGMPAIGTGYDLDYLDFEIENAKRWLSPTYNDFMPDEWFWEKKGGGIPFDPIFELTTNRELTKEEIAQINPLTWEFKETTITAVKTEDNKVADYITPNRYTFTFKTVPQAYKATLLINSWEISDKEVYLSGGEMTADMIIPTDEDIQNYLTAEQIANIGKEVVMPTYPDNLPATIYGDINNDNKVQMSDIVDLCQALSAEDITTVLTPQEIANADVFKDGVLDSADLSVFASAMVNSKLSTLPIYPDTDNSQPPNGDEIAAALEKERQEKLEELRKKGEENFGEYPRQERIILGRLSEDAPRLDLEWARQIAEDNYDDYDRIAEEFAGSQPYPDFVGGSGVTITEYWLDNEGTEKITLILEQQDIFYSFTDGDEIVTENLFLTLEQKTQLKDLRAKEGATWKYPRQERIIYSDITEDSPKLDLETAKDIIFEYTDYQDFEGSYYVILDKFKEIQRYPDYVTTNGNYIQYWLDDVGNDYIVVTDYYSILHIVIYENGELALQEGLFSLPE